MEDARVAILEALAMRNHSVQEGVIEGEGGDGSQQPTVPWDGKDSCQACSMDLPLGLGVGVCAPGYPC